MAGHDGNAQDRGVALGPDAMMYAGGGMGLVKYDGVR